MALFCYKSQHKIKTQAVEEVFPPSENEQSTSFFLDSAYKVVIDSQISIYKTKSGAKIKSFEKGFYSLISMAMHPSGSHLLVLDEASIKVYDVRSEDSYPVKEEDQV